MATRCIPAGFAQSGIPCASSRRGRGSEALQVTQTSIHCRIQVVCTSMQAVLIKQEEDEFVREASEAFIRDSQAQYSGNRRLV